MSVSNALVWAIAVAAATHAVSRVIGTRIWSRMSPMSDLGTLGQERKGRRRISGTAVICGGGIGGLFCARVCSDHFENVIVVESEDWVTSDAGCALNTHHKRSHVAQYHALHQFHMFMTVALRKLFPSFDKELESRGGRIIPQVQCFHLSGQPIPPPSDWSVDRYPWNVWMSRPAFETALRSLVVKNCANINYLSGTVTDLQREGTLIRSVTVKTKSGIHDVSTAFVIDCTGLALGGVRWLKSSIPDAIPFKITHDHKMAYTTAIYDIPSHLFSEINATGFPDYEISANIYGSHPLPTLDQRTIVIQRKENNILNIACGGWDVNARITSIDELRTFINTIVVLKPLPTWIQGLLDILEARGIEGIYVYSRSPPSSCVQYHKLLQYLPSNFVAVGDSWMATNPLGAQGCAKACAEAVTLNAHLSQCDETIPSDFTKKYFTSAWSRVKHVWEKSKSLDYSFPTTIPAKGETLASADGASWRKTYMRIYNKLVLQDAEVAAVAFSVSAWLRPPTSIFAPWVIGKVIREWIKLNIHV